MRRKDLSFGFLVGLLLSAVGAVALSVRPATPRAMAQGAPPSPPQRYQISAWAHPAGSVGPNLGGSHAMHGAYILDTMTGKVWQVREGGRPEPIGGVD
jgi:hypothetical protein